MSKYLVVMDNKVVIKEIEREKPLTTKQRTHILYELNQKYPMNRITLAKVSMEVYTPFLQVQR